MTSQLAVLMEKMRSVEAEIETELARRQEELRFRFENNRIVFEDEMLRVHRAIKTRVSRYLSQANPLIMLTAPVIYSLLIPIALLDIFVIIYQATCFPVYKIPQVRRRDYLIFDRHHLAYLNIIEKINCAYCSYANGAISFAREVAARTEVYWCPIKHARRILGPHPHYQGFADFGDADEYRKQLNSMKDGVIIGKT
ncbi:MAG TPA: hypothetical protein VF396_21255 [Bradyrhizobium sp.]